MNLKKNVLSIINNPKFFISLLLFITVFASVIRVIQSGIGDNYFIYRHSFFDLLTYSDLYVKHAGLNYYLYSPSFPLLFLPFAFLPPILGNVLWNLLNWIFIECQLMFQKFSPNDKIEYE